jgi:hypothetical protein
MKLVTVTLGADGSRPRSGWIILNYSAPDGGRTNIGVQVKELLDEAGAPIGLPTWEAIAAALHSATGGRPWPSFVKATVRGRQVRMACPDELNAVSFYAEYQPSLEQIGPVELSPAFVAIEEEVF